MVSKGIERKGGHQGLQIRVISTDERKLARGAVHNDIRNPWSGDIATMTFNIKMLISKKQDANFST